MCAECFTALHNSKFPLISDVNSIYSLLSKGSVSYLLKQSMCSLVNASFWKIHHYFVFFFDYVGEFANQWFRETGKFQNIIFFTKNLRALWLFKCPETSTYSKDWKVQSSSLCAFHSDDSVRVIPKETFLNDTNQSIVPSPISWTMGCCGRVMLLLETSWTDVWGLGSAITSDGNASLELFLILSDH